MRYEAQPSAGNLRAAARLELEQLADLEPAQADAAEQDVWPLQLVDPADASQLDVLHALLGRTPLVAQHSNPRPHPSPSPNPNPNPNPHPTRT